jgi:hypothetical protein
MNAERKQIVSQGRIRHIVKHSVWIVDCVRAIATRLVHDIGAQDLAEYGIALAVIGTAAGAVAIVLAQDVGTLWTSAQSVIQLAP